MVDRLHLIKSPTLVITGSHDRIIPPERSEVLARSIPDARLVLLEGGSHTIMVEKRKEFNRAVLDFLVSPQG